MIALLELLTAAGTLSFWYSFFTDGKVKPQNPPAGYYAYENSFPIPDTILSCAMITAALLKTLRNPLGKVLTIICSGALIFLGILDMCFNTVNGVYKNSPKDFFGNAVINLWCVFFGIYAARKTGTDLLG